MKLNATRVTEILKACMFTNAEVANAMPPYVEANGVHLKAGLHPDRLNHYREEVAALLDELPRTFQGLFGDSFLRMCEDKHGTLWGQHANLDELVALGNALDMVDVYPKNRHEWASMPGGMPNILVTLPRELEESETPQEELLPQHNTTFNRGWLARTQNLACVVPDADERAAEEWKQGWQAAEDNLDYGWEKAKFILLKHPE